MQKKTEVEPLERVCLYYEIMSERNDFKTAWRLCKNRPADEIIDANHSLYYKWISSRAVKREIALIKEEKRMREQLLKDTAKKEIEVALGDKMDKDVVKVAMGDSSLATNFRSKEEALSWLNEQMNLCANDESKEKKQMEIMKLIADFSRFKETGNEDKEQDIQRFYTPLLCKECELYKMQKERMERDEKARRKAER